MRFLRTKLSNGCFLFYCPFAYLYRSSQKNEALKRNPNYDFGSKIIKVKVEPEALGADDCETRSLSLSDSHDDLHSF